MKVVDISAFKDSVALHFETNDHEINAYTLASILSSIADAAKAANSSINIGCEIEIVVEALGQGSFRAKIKALYKEGKNLFSSQLVKEVIIGIIINYIYDRTFASDNNVKIEIHTDEVVIEKGDEKIVVSRNVHDATREAEKNPKFTQAMDKTLNAIVQDTNIEGIGFVQDIGDPKPDIIISRESIIEGSGIVADEEGSRIITELVELKILKAILERSRKKWGFMWRGVKISAPVTDMQFYNRFCARDITIAPGDSLHVTLQIKQIKDDDTGVYVNKSYEVVEVHEHIPASKQAKLPE